MKTTRPSVVRKLIDNVYLLRVSGKADLRGSAGQLDVLRQYDTSPDVAEFLRTFDVEMMSASSARGRKLRAMWQREGRLRVLSRQGRQDFLGVLIDIGRSRFIVYASSAAKMDEGNANAFTRHVCETIADPAFSGEGDPDHQAKLDAKGYDEHPAVLHAFDPTRFCRTQANAMDIWTAADRHGAALDTGDLFLDPATGTTAQMMWMMVAYGSAIEALVGKQRRMVGRLNIARDGRWCYREGQLPLGCGAQDAEDGRGRVLIPDQSQQPIVELLAKLGLDLANTNEVILEALAREHGLISHQPMTKGKRVDELDPSAAKRFFVRGKLEAYRDGELPLTFIGAVPNQFQVGSGHIFRRRWLGFGGPDDEPDRYGAITYRIPFPKPTVTGPDGQPRDGWLNGYTDAEERKIWDRLIILRGRDADGRRILDDIPTDAALELSPEEQHRIRSDGVRRDAAARGGNPGRRAIANVFTPYTDDANGRGPRYWFRNQGPRAAVQNAGYCQLRRETVRGAGGISRARDASEPVASFRERDLTSALADVILGTVEHVIRDGQTVGHLDAPRASTSSPEVGDEPNESEQADAAAALVQRASLAKGYDRSVALLLGEGTAEDAPQLIDARLSAKSAWHDVAQAQRAVERLNDLKAREPSTPLELDVTDVRDIVVGLKGIYGRGAVPGAFAAALRALVPEGFRLAPGDDDLTWLLRAQVCLPLSEGGTMTVDGPPAPVPNIAGRGAGGNATGRTVLMLQRRFHDGQSLPELGDATLSVDLAGMRRTLTKALRATGLFPTKDRVQIALDNPIIEATHVLWAAINKDSRQPGSTFAEHIRRCYFGPPTTGAEGWALDVNRDQRLDQLTVVTHARDLSDGINAAALGRIIGSSRSVLDSSMVKEHCGRVIYPTLDRTPTDGYPNGWHGKGTTHLADAAKCVRPVSCPHADCPERWATVLCPVFEVTQLGAAILCRHCRRAATPPSDPRHIDAARIVFPQSYIDWADGHSRRAGTVAACAATGCTRDVGLGAGRVWVWTDEAATDGRAWHDASCQGGIPLSAFSPCKLEDCTLDEGGGPGRIYQVGRGRRSWHSDACRQAERRRGRHPGQ